MLWCHTLVRRTLNNLTCRPCQIAWSGYPKEELDNNLLSKEITRRRIRKWGNRAKNKRKIKRVCLGEYWGCRWRIQISSGVLKVSPVSFPRQSSKECQPATGNEYPNCCELSYFCLNLALIALLCFVRLFVVISARLLHSNCIKPITLSFSLFTTFLLLYFLFILSPSVFCLYRISYCQYLSQYTYTIIFISHILTLIFKSVGK